MRTDRYPIFRILFLFVAAFALASCSESDEAEEYPDWQNTNETYFSKLYASAKAQADAGSSQWKVIRSFALNADVATDPDDYIVVEVLEEGEGSGCPLYTDSVRVHYLGRLLPSTSYSEGYVFDQSYYGEYNTATAAPATLAVSSVIDGFSTALQNMHIGDRWRVYIPYALGYGSTVNGAIPAYSTLIFDITLVAYYRAGVDVPDFKAKSW